MAAVAAILLTALLPKFQQTGQRLQAERAAFELAQLARYAHARAVAEGVEVRLEWSERDRRAYLSTVPAEGPATQLTDAAARSAVLPAEVVVTITREEQPAACGCARLFADGTSDGATWAVGWQNRILRITIDGATSQVLVSAGPVPASENLSPGPAPR